MSKEKKQPISFLEFIQALPPKREAKWSDKQSRIMLINDLAKKKYINVKEIANPKNNEGTIIVLNPPTSPLNNGRKIDKKDNLTCAKIPRLTVEKGGFEYKIARIVKKSEMIKILRLKWNNAIEFPIKNINV